MTAKASYNTPVLDDYGTVTEITKIHSTFVAMSVCDPDLWNYAKAADGLMYILRPDGSLSGGDENTVVVGCVLPK